jgi:membrane-bound lytic murein transglycosylase D
MQLLIHFSIHIQPLKKKMFFRYNKPLFIVFLVGTLFSGCTEKNLLTTQHDFQPVSENSKAGEAAIPSELQPVPAEPETCLVQELDELRQTGSWNNSTKSERAELSLGPIQNFPIVHNKQVAMYLKLFQNKQKNQLKRWFARSGVYSKLMTKELSKAGLPSDLVYLAMIESGFNQRAYSRSRALGLWQFMKGTGKEYNLKIDRYVDERRDAEKSTKAAVSYLGALYEQFGDWHLAVAAYNAGPGKIRYGLKKYNVKTFWELAEKRYLKLETKRYVPKLIAAIIISRAPELYGFNDISLDSPLKYDKLEVGPGLSLDAVAMITKSSPKQIQFLNQELKTGKTPLNQKSYLVKIPAGTQKLANQNLSRLHSVVTTKYKSHSIRRGETVSSICRRYKINTTTLLKANNLRKGKLIAGNKLRIPYNTVGYQLLPKGSKAIASSKNNLILHKIRQGETISKIAKRYNVPPELLVSWNGLRSVHSIRTGQQLALYINTASRRKSSSITVGRLKQSPSLKSAISSGFIDNTIILAASKKQRPQEEHEDPIRWYRVKNGDSLWTISRKFKTSPKKLKKLNNLKTNRIHPGSKLKVETA